MNNEERDQQLYRYPDSNVLRNKLDLRDGATLNRTEARFVEIRSREGIPSGNFDLAHLSSIHRQLFQDIYEWAGEVRQTNIGKRGASGEAGDGRFHHHSLIVAGVEDLHRRLSAQDFLKGMKPANFAQDAAEYIGDINRLHPFREGNGRTQLQYLKQLGQRAGHHIDLIRFDRKSWIQASIEANKFETGRMAACIRNAMIEQKREQLSPRQQALFDSLDKARDQSSNKERGDHDRER